MRQAGTRMLLAAALLGAALAGARAAPAGPSSDDPFEFVVIGHTFPGESGDDDLKRTIARADKARPAFVIAAGIKSASEACSDKLYQQRRTLLNKSDRPLMVVLASGDWTDCRNSAGRSNALERLNRIRELYFDSRESLGERKLELNRQSTITKFRSYAENAYWERGGVLFATINLPANNNHYLTEAGRNSEYEDRFVANRAWLQRLFGMAKRRKLAGLVLFSDGDLRAHVEQGFSLLAGFSAKQDGFADTRKLVRTLAEKYPGKVLLVDTARPPADPAGAKGAEPPGTLTWRGNLGHVTLTGEWNAVRVEPDTAGLFTLIRDSHPAEGGRGEAKKAEKTEKADKPGKAERAP
ncbi:hypothetical protein [Pseudoduganella chitinolytica]|uniref:Transmembrane protein n=1 Tax=Pseudoduganella chitinolytica TaxID=34070 RepID=A0ABY8BF53_9BURK|nr:hypothetical protein [Pseudoduganella chitinolytica]WEF33352.1 hypothetical protein PX653_00740 [Pseudoduganella chitinolytica]